MRGGLTLVRLGWVDPWCRLMIGLYWVMSCLCLCVLQIADDGAVQVYDLKEGVLQMDR